MKKDIKAVVPGFYTVDDALKFDFETVKELQHTHLNKTRTILGESKYFVKAEDFLFTDHAGDIHYDFIGAVGVCSVGNNNPFIWQELTKVFEARAFNFGAISYHNVAAAFAANMAKLSPGGKLTKMFTATGGAEAIEGALKLVKLATRDSPKKTDILSCEGAFHGKTSGAVTVGGKDKWRTYQNALPGHTYVPFGDIAALEAELKKGTYKAFFVEPIQGENGIKVPPAGYLAKARELCTKYGVIMVLDEIQAGFGRSGKLWCCEHDGIIPDVIVFAKGASGGLIPFAGYIAKEEIYDAAYASEETCFHHTATYQENAMSCAAGNAALQFIYENDLISAAAEKGDYFMKGLKKLQEKYPKIIKEVRGKGLMIGVEFFEVPAGKEADFGSHYSLFLCHTLVSDFRIQMLYTINNLSTYRYLPPFTITKEAIDHALDCTEKALQKAVEVIGY